MKVFNRIPGLILAYIIGLSPAIAMQESSELIGTRPPSRLTQISDITPVKNEMNKEEARLAICSFLQTEVLKPENEIRQSEILKIEEARTNGVGRMFRLVTLKDGTQWVPGSAGLQRFIGALYLKKAIESHNLSQWSAAETKFMFAGNNDAITIHVKELQEAPLKGILTINSDGFISLSRYIGDQKPGFDLDFLKEKSNLKKMTGYHDFELNANLRTQEDDSKVYIIDTEYGSFTYERDALLPSQKETELGGTSFTFARKDFLQ